MEKYVSYNLLYFEIVVIYYNSIEDCLLIIIL